MPEEQNHKNTPQVRSIVDIINHLQKYNHLHAEESRLTQQERAYLDILLDFSRKAVDSFRQAQTRTEEKKNSIIMPRKDIIVP